MLLNVAFGTHDFYESISVALSRICTTLSGAYRMEDNSPDTHPQLVNIGLIQRSTWETLQHIHKNVAILLSVIHRMEQELLTLTGHEEIEKLVSGMIHKAYDRMVVLVGRLSNSQAPCYAAPLVEHEDFLKEAGKQIAEIERLLSRYHILSERIQQAQQDLSHVDNLIVNVAEKMTALDIDEKVFSLKSSQGVSQPLVRAANHILDASKSIRIYIDSTQTMISEAKARLDHISRWLNASINASQDMLSALREVANAICDIEYNTDSLAGLTAFATLPWQQYGRAAP